MSLFCYRAHTISSVMQIVHFCILSNCIYHWTPLWFSKLGRLITAKYIPESKYYKWFPKASTASSSRFWSQTVKQTVRKEEGTQTYTYSTYMFPSFIYLFCFLCLIFDNLIIISCYSSRRQSRSLDLVIAVNFSCAKNVSYLVFLEQRDYVMCGPCLLKHWRIPHVFCGMVH